MFNYFAQANKRCAFTFDGGNGFYHFLLPQGSFYPVTAAKQTRSGLPGIMQLRQTAKVEEPFDHNNLRLSGRGISFFSKFLIIVERAIFASKPEFLREGLFSGFTKPRNSFWGFVF
jgi:hypothetical protein